MAKFKTSLYNINFRNNKGDFVLVNLLSRAIAEVEKKNEDIVKYFLNNPNAIPKSVSEEKIFNELKYGGYIVDQDFDEIGHIRLKNLMDRFDRSIVSITIMPTMQCNFDCVYCYEKKSGSVMSFTIADSVIQFLTKMVKEKRVINLGWFGGEPLIAFRIIEYINSAVVYSAKKYKTKFNSFITTNGYLLDEEKINRLESLNINSLQITLDGPPEYHDRYRRLKGGGGTFSKIFYNLENLFRKTTNVSVKLRVNVGPDNYNSIEKLLDMIKVLPKERFVIYFRWIFKGSDLNPEFHRRVDLFMGSPKEKFLKLANLFYKAIDQGYNVMLPILNGNVYCEYDRINSILIGPNGNLYLCTVAVGEEAKAGKITPEGPVYNRNTYEKWHNFSAFSDEKCITCPLLPLCFGGCRNARMNGMPRGCPEELGYIEEFAKLWYYVKKAEKGG